MMCQMQNDTHQSRPAHIGDRPAGRLGGGVGGPHRGQDSGPGMRGCEATSRTPHPPPRSAHPDHYASGSADRGGRPPGGYGSGSDWFVGKGHDTFAPHGPWIVPKEFYGDPMERLHQTLVIDGVTVQEARAGDMIHNIPELIEYASSLITIFPGDVLQSGTSGGTGAGRVERATGSGFLIDGETIEANIEGIGTLHHTVRLERSIPSDLSGSQLPPVSSYRN